MSSINVGLFTRVSSVFQRAVPSVKVSGVWTTGNRMYTKVSGVWETVWADANRSLGGTTRTIQSFDLVTAKSGWQTLSGGSIQIKRKGPEADVFISSGNWLVYEFSFSICFKHSNGHIREYSPLTLLL